MKIEDVIIGDMFYVPIKEGYTPVRKGHVIEIHTFHETVLLAGIPYPTGNFGATLEDLYKCRDEAYKAYEGSKS